MQCLNCSKELTSKRSDAKFCSSYCNKHYRYIQNKDIINEKRKYMYDNNINGYRDKIKTLKKNYRLRKKKDFSKYKDNVRFGGNRKLTLERDNYTCQHCGKKSGLSVHHIDRSGQTDNPNHDLSNLITLCSSCHSKQHTRDYDVIVTSVCKYCGKEYEAHRHDIIKGRHIYCSRECADKAKVGQLKTAYIANCIVCGSEFKTTPYKISLGKGKYCSLTCSSESQKKRIKVTCQWCGQEFETIEAKLKQGRGKFCSRKCSGKHSRQEQLKNKNKE